MENPVAEFIDWLDIVHHLPYKMAGVIIDAEIPAGYDIKKRSPKRRRGKQILASRPLLRAEQHGAVLNRNFYIVLLCIPYDRRPYLPERFKVFLHTFCLFPSDEGCDQAHSQFLGETYDLLQMGNGCFPFLQIAVHCIGIICQGAYGNSCPAAYFLNMLHISMAGIVYIDVAYPCVPPFRFSVRPACGFNTLIPHPGSSFHHFLKCPSIQDSAYKPYLHPIPLRLS